MKLRAFEAVAQALHDAQVRYLVAGRLAVNAHGYLRFTADIQHLRWILEDESKK